MMIIKGKTSPQKSQVAKIGSIRTGLTLVGRRNDVDSAMGVYLSFRSCRRPVNISRLLLPESRLRTTELTGRICITMYYFAGAENMKGHKTAPICIKYT